MAAPSLATHRHSGGWTRDPLLWLAAGAAVPVWALLALWELLALGRPVGDLAWPLALPGTFLLLVLVYPVVEELVFRGALQGALLGRAWGVHRWGPLSVANGLTALAFAALHGLYQPWGWALAVLAPALVFGFFRERHATLITPILLHIFYNAGFLWLFGADMVQR